MDFYTEIECSRCNDLVGTTAHYVELPFVCSRCNEKPADTAKPVVSRDTVRTFGTLLKNPILQDVLNKDGKCIDYAAVNEYLRGQGLPEIFVPKPSEPAPPSNVPASQQECSGCETTEPAQDACSTATLDNTTLLIEDMQKQLQAANETLSMKERELQREKVAYARVNRAWSEKTKELESSKKQLKAALDDGNAERERADIAEEFETRSIRSLVDAMHRLAYSMTTGDMLVGLSTRQERKIEELKEELALAEKTVARQKNEIRILKNESVAFAERSNFNFLRYTEERDKPWWKKLLGK